MKTNCKNCGVEFEYWTPTPTHYCTDQECQKSKNEREQKKRKAWLAKQKSICQTCGNVFPGYRAKYCKECVPKTRKQEKYYPNQKKIIKPPKNNQNYANYLRKDKKKNWAEYKPTDIHGNKVECTTAHSGHG